MPYQLKMNGGKKASFQNYIKMNEGLKGINWTQVDKDRSQLGLPPHSLEFKTQFENE